MNHERIQTLLGHYWGHAEDTQNTAMCLFAPHAAGLSADSFPTHESVYFGTRPGKRNTYILPTKEKLSDKEIFQMVTYWRRVQTNGKDMDPEAIKRICWEYKNVYDGVGLAKVMDELAAMHPLVAGSEAGTPVLPVMADLKQALDVAAADPCAVIVVVHPAERDEAMEQRVARLAFEEGIAGRAYIARLTMPEWAQANETGQISGGSLAAGVYFVAPDSFGLSGEVWAEIASDATEDGMRAELAAVLDRFLKTYKKLDRMSHAQAGVEKNISWSEYDPEAGGVVRIGPGSRKLGKNYQPLDN